MKNIRILVGLIMLGWCLHVHAQSYDTTYFRSPVNHPILLGGSFAELRSTHFHAGIDIKPKSKESQDSVFAAADGYIARVKVQTGGYGQVIYIKHPNGMTTVYAHLRTLSPEVANYVLDLQRRAESYSIEAFPDRNSFSLKKGDFIGLMGNTGRSYGKHLHFEIRNTVSDVPINPALFGLKPKDTRAPTILSVDVNALTSDYQIPFTQTYIPERIGKNRYTINGGHVAFPFWRCGIGVQSHDKMDGADNKNGVVYQKLYIDNELVHSFRLDAVSFDQSRYINSHINYAEKIRSKRTVTNSYTYPYNQLDIYGDHNSDGTILLQDTIPKSVEVVLGDIEGNESVIEFAIVRDSTSEPSWTASYNMKIEPFGDTLSIYGAKLMVPDHSIDRPMYIVVSKEDSIFSIGTREQVLFNRGSLFIPMIEPKTWDEKSYIGYYNGDQWISLGGDRKGDFLYTEIKYLGDFRIMKDTIPPTIDLPPPRKEVLPGSSLTAIIGDDIAVSGTASEVRYTVYLDGKIIICPYKSLTRELTIPIPSDTTEGRHTIHIEVEDDRGNITKEEVVINISE